MAQIAAAVAVIGGTLLSYKGQKDAGAAARRAGTRENVARQFEAEQLRQQATQVIAASQRQALGEMRQGDIVASRAIALAAASGGGVSDPTIVNLLARTKGEGAYRAGVALYEGEEQARKLRMKAASKLYEGAGAEEAGIYREAAHKTLAKASLFKGTAHLSLFSKYGGGGPPGGSGDAALLDAGSADLYDVG